MNKKNKLASLIFPLLVKGINGANLYDTRVQEEVNNLPLNFTVALDIFPYGNYITFKLNKSCVQKVKNVTKPDLKIIFKNNKVANKVLLGRMSIAQAFSNHALLVKGDIYKAMGLVRIINLVENYLFPKWFTKHIYRYPKQVSTLKMYCYVLFGKGNKKRELDK